jgi:hypothetical protein
VPLLGYGLTGTTIQTEALGDTFVLRGLTTVTARSTQTRRSRTSGILVPVQPDRATHDFKFDGGL